MGLVCFSTNREQVLNSIPIRILLGWLQSGEAVHITISTEQNQRRGTHKSMIIFWFQLLGSKPIYFWLKYSRLSNIWNISSNGYGSLLVEKAPIGVILKCSYQIRHCRVCPAYRTIITSKQTNKHTGKNNVRSVKHSQDRNPWPKHYFHSILYSLCSTARDKHITDTNMVYSLSGSRQCLTSTL